MKYWTTSFRTGQQAQHLDDLEDILNSPAPALGSQVTSIDKPSSDAECPVNRITPAVSLPTSIAKDSQPDQSVSLAPAHLQPCNRVAGPSLQGQLPVTCSEEPGQTRRLSVWSSAYHSASAPLTAVWARVPEQVQRYTPLWATESDRDHTGRLPFLLEHMARNKGATAAATIAGAAAGGAIAGPLGIAAGAKSGAFMVAIGAAAAGAAQHYYLPVAPQERAVTCTQNVQQVASGESAPEAHVTS